MRRSVGCREAEPERVQAPTRPSAFWVVGADAKAFSDSLREVLVATLSEDVDADALADAIALCVAHLQAL